MVRNPPPAAGQVVMATGNAPCRNARPTSAGLNTFCPRPPHTCFPKTMANAAPSAVIHSGNPAGSERPSRSPVIVAEPSAITPPFPVERSMMSETTTAVAICNNALMPKNHAADRTTGMRLATTCHMMRGVESSDRMCGEAVTMSRLSVTRPPPARAGARPCSPGRAETVEYSTDRHMRTIHRACSRRDEGWPSPHIAVPGRSRRVRTD